MVQSEGNFICSGVNHHDAFVVAAGCHDVCRDRRHGSRPDVILTTELIHLLRANYFETLTVCCLYWWTIFSLAMSQSATDLSSEQLKSWLLLMQKKHRCTGLRTK
jgi:hypothetical protein